ncbi:hypothetical protein L596_026527 [Steinernema carpocapsae]|uniref:7TM GPCR serpentine receptor class x (Srx) domain-containing protein n=1 Tax=Steinernema carpocapsae TaxID=34508 RepID=A0A4U5M2M1_STECR|nr:hypothetical protein L596_026527 [Steinernema carpocapsae]
MSFLRFIVCGVYVGLSVFFTPLYAGIIYVFFKKPQYRRLRCYRLIIQLGIAHCIMSFGFITAGISSALQYDPGNIAGIGAKIMTACIRVETGLNLALALDRIKIVCGLPVPSFVHVTLVVFSWCFGVAHFVLLMTPLSDFPFNATGFAPKYDYSKPLSLIQQRVGYFYSLICAFLTFCVYVIVVSYLLHKQLKHRMQSSDFKQKSIFGQAFIRFAADATVTVFYHLGPLFLTPALWLSIVIVTGYLVTYLIIPPVSLIVLNRTFRKEVFNTEHTSGVVNINVSQCPSSFRGSTTGHTFMKNQLTLSSITKSITKIGIGKK